MLYLCGETKMIGRVDSGDTVTDFLPQERERGITIQSAAISMFWKNYQINLIDTFVLLILHPSLLSNGINLMIGRDTLISLWR